MGARQSNLFDRLIGKRSGVHVTLSGGRELVRNFEILTVKTQRKVARAAVTSVARKMVREVKSTMAGMSSMDSGLLRKSMGFRMWTKQSPRWAVGATIGARTGFGRFVIRNVLKSGKLSKKSSAVTQKQFQKRFSAGKTFKVIRWADPWRYSHLVEGGTKVRLKRGRMPADPFMERTYLKSRDVMAGTLRTQIRKGIEREARKLPKRRIAMLSRGALG